MQTVPDFIELELKAKDVIKESNFKVAFKLLEPVTARTVLKRLYRYTYEAQCAVLISNIVYVSQLADSKGNLTNSFEKSIIKELLQSMPYFQSIIGNFVALLQNTEQVQRRSLQEQNLFEIGKYQYELDYGKQDEETLEKKKTEELQETMGSFMKFEEDEPSIVETTPVVETSAQFEKLPNLLWKSNVPFLQIFNIAKFHQTDIVIGDTVVSKSNPIVLIELAKELELKLSETLSYIPVIQAGYNSLKQKETT